MLEFSATMLFLSTLLPKSYEKIIFINPTKLFLVSYVHSPKPATLHNHLFLFKLMKSSFAEVGCRGLYIFLVLGFPGFVSDDVIKVKTYFFEKLHLLLNFSLERNEGVGIITC